MPTVDQLAAEARREMDRPQNRTFKQNLEDAGTHKSAFSQARFEGLIWNADDSIVQLMDQIGRDKRGIHFKVADGYAVTVKLTTPAFNVLYDSGGLKAAFAQEGRSNDFLFRQQASSGSSAINILLEGYDKATFILRRGDYISFDIEKSVTGIAEAKVVINSRDGTSQTIWTNGGSTHGNPLNTHLWVEAFVSDISESAAGEASTQKEAEEVGATTSEEEAAQKANEAESYKEEAEKAENAEAARRAAEEAERVAAEAAAAAQRAATQSGAEGAGAAELAAEEEASGAAQRAAEAAEAAQRAAEVAEVAQRPDEGGEAETSGAGGEEENIWFWVGVGIVVSLIVGGGLIAN